MPHPRLTASGTANPTARCPMCGHTKSARMALRLRVLGRLHMYESPGLCHHDMQLEMPSGAVECGCPNPFHLP